MNRISIFIIFVICAILMTTSCVHKYFYFVDSIVFNEKVQEQFGNDTMKLLQDPYPPHDRAYLMGIALKDTFIGGELTFTQTVDYDLSRKYIQYCYMLFDNNNNVFYNTVASDDMLDENLSVEIPREVFVDSLKFSDYSDALQGKFFREGDTMFMIMESKEQENLIYMKAIINPDDESFTIFQVTRERVNFTPLNNLKHHNPKQKVYDLQNVFSIALTFNYIPEIKNIKIRRDPKTYQGKNSYK